jgi:hypothetical protein
MYKARSSRAMVSSPFEKRQSGIRMYRRIEFWRIKSRRAHVFSNVEESLSRFEIEAQRATWRCIRITVHVFLAYGFRKRRVTEGMHACTALPCTPDATQRSATHQMDMQIRDYGNWGN